MVENKPLFTRPDLLMQPQLVKPLHGLAPRTIMGQAWWNKTRQKCYAVNEYHCFACGIHKSNAKFHQWLEAHESYEIDFEKRQYRLIEIVALCHACHNFIHAGRLQAMYDKGAISEYKYREVHQWGNDILFFAGLDKSKAWWTAPDIHPKFFPELNGTWEGWHLLFNGTKYYSRWKTYDEWKAFYDDIDEDN